ncbi:MAG: starch-binding protein, partial [Prevotella sp.]|nr:starch-binding protein [Prevotella sp.]
MKKKLALFLAAFVALVTYTVRAAIQEAEPEVLFTMNCTGEADVKTDGDVAGDTPTEYSLANYASFGVDNTSAAFYKLAKQGTTTAKYIGKLGSGNVRFCLANGGDKVYFKITLSKAIEVGDVISWDVYPNNADTEKTTGLLFNKEASTTGVGYGEVLTDADVQKKACPQSYTVKKDDNIVGVTELYVTRTGGLGTYFDNLKIIRPAADESQQTPDYYVVGSMNNWTTSDTYKFTANAEAEGEYMFTGDFSKGDEFKVTSSEGAWYPDGQDNNYVIKEDGNYTIYFRPDGKGGDDWYYGCFYVALNEVTPDPTITYPVTAKWDWEAKYEPTTLADVHIEKGKGSVESNVKGISMFVDATSGKLQTAKDQNFTQFNTGTILQVPVGTTKDVVTVKAHSYNFENIKVGGVVSTDLTTNHTATAEEVAAGYVVIESTASPYLYSVQVTMQDPNATPEPQPTLVGYYVVGNMTGWDTYDEAYKLLPGENGSTLYTLTKEFKANDEIKVKSKMSEGDGAWYPAEGDNFKFDQDGNYIITFDPAGGNAEWFGGCIDVKMEEQPIILNDYTVQFINGANWDEVFAYTWTGESDAKVEQLNPWAGTAMRLTNTFEEIDGIRYPVYELKFQHAIEPANIIFSNGKGGEVGKTQTENLAFENNHKYQLIIKPQLYNVNIAEIENGTVLADPTQAEAGATITLTARPAEGYELDGEIMVTCAHEDKVIPVENGTFMMPADDVTVNATFKKQGGDEPVAETETIEFTAAGTGTNPMVYTEDHFTYTFDKGSGSNNPAYVANAGETRLYAKGSLTIKANAGEKISKIVFDAAINANKNGVAPTIDGVAGTTAEGTWDAENWTWTGEDTEVQMSTSGSAGNVGFKSITVTYTSSGDVPQPVVINSMAINGTFPGMSWDADKGIAMTKSVDNEAVWTLTMENVTVEGQKYEYKAFANGETTGYQLPSAEQGNADFVFGTDKYPAGEYTLTFTANTKNHTLTLDVKKNGINTIKELNAQNNGTEFSFVGDAIVVATAAKGNAKYVYIKDDTGSSLIYEGTANYTANLGVGNVITAPWTGKVSIYKNLFEAIPTAALGATSTVEVKYPEVTADYVKAENMNQVVLIKGLSIEDVDTRGNIKFTIG